MLDIDEFVTSPGADQAAVAPAPPGPAAWVRLGSGAVQRLRPLADALDDMEARFYELIARTEDLDCG